MNINMFQYNSIVIITYFILSFLAYILNIITRGKSNKYLFTNYRSSLLNPLTYIRMFTFCIGHVNLDHFINNFLYILLLGPLIEEKYGSINLLYMFLITSFITSLFNMIVTNKNIIGASGNVYMLIILSSFTGFSSGQIPITLILVAFLYVIRDFINEFNNKKKVYLAGHIIGSLCGVAFGFYFLK